MRSIIWLAPDGARYEVVIVKEPFDRHQSIVFRRDDGWIGAARIADGEDLRSLMSDEIAQLLSRAKQTQ